MKSNNIKISIAEPCHEDWKKMTQEKEGKFCDSCAKTVIDFSKKTLDEITGFFQNKKEENTCGRFSKLQLEMLNHVPAKSSPQWKTWLAAFAGILTVGSLNSCDIPSTQASSFPSHLISSQSINDTTSNYAFYIKNAHNQAAVAHAKVQFPEYGKTFYSNPDGKVVINTSFLSKPQAKILVTNDGFMPVEMTLDIRKKNLVVVHLESEEMMVVGEIEAIIIPEEEPECNMVKGKIKVETPKENKK